MVLVGQQGEPEPVLLVELGLLGRFVRADAEHRRVPDVTEDVPHAASLGGASRRVRLRVEEHQHLAALQVGQVQHAAGLVGQGDRRGRVTGGERHGANVAVGDVAPFPPSR